MIVTLPAVKLKLDKWPHRKIITHISSIILCFFLGCMLIPCHIINFKPWFGPNWENFVYFGSNLAVFSSISTLVTILSMSMNDVIIGKTPWYRWFWLLYSLILTLQYWFTCDFDSKSLEKKNCNPWVQVYCHVPLNKYGCYLHTNPTTLPLKMYSEMPHYCRYHSPKNDLHHLHITLPHMSAKVFPSNAIYMSHMQISSQ